MALLAVSDLEVAFPRGRGEAYALRGVDLSLERGERLGVVGESGAGKSMLAFAILNLIQPPGRIAAGAIRFEGRDILTLPPRAVRAIRGDRMSMIFQDPMMTLNPVLTIGTQLVETLKAHRRISDRAARQKAIEQLAAVQIPSPESRLESYPHQLSGGLRQRVVIAIALITEPEIVIADEPSTALDVTIQAEIMALLLRLCRDTGVGLILITHDLAVVAEVTERLMLMYAGKVVEEGPTGALIAAPRHPYSAGLLGALPQRTPRDQRLTQIPGTMPGIGDVPAGCAYHPRCPRAVAACAEAIPPLEALDGRRCACIRPLEPVA